MAMRASVHFVFDDACSFSLSLSLSLDLSTSLGGGYLLRTYSDTHKYINAMYPAVMLQNENAEAKPGGDKPKRPKPVHGSILKDKDATPAGGASRRRRTSFKEPTPSPPPMHATPQVRRSSGSGGGGGSASGTSRRPVSYVLHIVFQLGV